MANTIIHAVQITLAAEYSQNTAIGLYTESGISYLRWCEAQLYGTALDWMHGLILKGGMDAIEASSDLRSGGAVANYGGTTVRLANAESLMQSIKDLQINIIGQPVIIKEFIGTMADSDSVSSDTIFTGVVERPEWGETELIIPLKNSLYKRETNLSVTNANGITTPITFGKHYPRSTDKVDTLAKFVRTDESITLLNDNYFTGSLETGTTMFPIESVTSETVYNILLRGTTISSITTPENLYITVVDGDSDSIGERRYVTNLFLYISSGSAYCQVTIADVFIKTLSVSGDDRAWVKFELVDRIYAADSWNCSAFYTSAGSANTRPEIFTYDNENKKHNRVADFGFEIENTTSKNTLKINGSQFSNDIDNIDGFTIIPATNISPSTDPISGYTYIDDGLFHSNTSDVGAIELISGSTNSGDYDKAIDKDSTTYATFTATDLRFKEVGGPQYPQSFYVKNAIKIQIPTLPKNCDVSNCYFAIKGTFNCDSDIGSSDKVDSISVTFNRYVYPKSTDTESISLSGINETLTVNNMLDQYFTDTVDSGNVTFYKLVNTGATFSGYTLFELSTITDENYGIIKDITLVVTHRHFTGVDPLFSVDDKIYDVVIIFKSAATSIKKEIYSPLAGRMFYDTWQSRKTATALMESPVDIIEHCKRLQNWSEYSPSAFDWGHQYAVTEDPVYYDRIKLTGDGSYDSTNLSYLTDQKCAMQITDSNKATTTELVRRLCNAFDVCTYIDEDGYECIETLQKTNPSETILLSDQIGAIGNVIEPDISDIYCEPVIKYAFDQGSGEYTKALKVTNITENVYNASYTEGFSGSDGETVWNACKGLYNQFHHVEQCPSSFSEMPLVTDYTTVLGILTRRVAWMNKYRLPTITISYTKGSNYNIFKHIKVQLPCHTNNILVECIIERIIKEKNKGIVKLDCVVLDEAVDAWFDNADTGDELLDNYTTGDEIQKV